MTGSTKSTNFPTTLGAYQMHKGGVTNVTNAFVTKFNPDGTGLEYSTYLGGSKIDIGYGIALNAAGEAYVGGYTTSNDFPVVYLLQQMPTGWQNYSRLAFVSRLNASGSDLIYSTYFGGNGSNQVNGIAVDSTGDAYVTGQTTSPAFPTLNPFQTTNNGGTTPS